MNRVDSELLQERAGKLGRNRQVEYLYFVCHLKQADIARKFGVSRQCIHQIIKRFKGWRKKKPGFWGRLLDRVLYFLNDY